MIIYVGMPGSDVLRGDLNDDGSVDNLDVEYLLWHTLFLFVTYLKKEETQ